MPASHFLTFTPTGFRECFQKFEPFDVICFSDHSLDVTFASLQEGAYSDCRIVVI